MGTNRPRFNGFADDVLGVTRSKDIRHKIFFVIGTPGLVMAPDEPARINPAGKESLLSPATADTVTGMFTQLAAFRREQRRSTEFPMGGAERTLEDVVRELLNPMMREWLEQKLAPIIERAVRVELARVLDQADGA
jgi:cell pole-organizing protein PopZ